MRVVIWNDQENIAQDIESWFKSNGHTDCKQIIENNFVDFCLKLGSHFDSTIERSAFFKENLIVSDLCLAAGGTPFEKAKPFRDLATKLLDDHTEYPIILFSVMANNPAIVGSDIYHYVKRVPSGNVNDLIIFENVWKIWQERNQ